ncbi:MAG: sulfatase-like hydrolase/transferase [Alphaproteobacteria bacterium]|nr:sulfatase-like hydrolase/transferase [Alphaproteobacteria bacterium]
MFVSKKFVRGTLISVGVAASLILPDALFQLANSSYQCPTAMNVLKLLTPLSIGLVFNRFRLLTWIVFMFLLFLQLTQFSHISYFGSPLSPYDFYAIFADYHDIAEEAVNAFADHWLVLPVVFIPFALMFFLLKVNVKRSVVGTVILLGTFCGAYYSNCQKRNPAPNPFRFAFDNGLKSLCIYCDALKRDYHPRQYLPYEIKNVGFDDSEPITIVYILGESSNFRHMSLFGYERETTPQLKELAKSSNFHFTQGLGGICTRTANKFMMNVIYEPDNTKLIYSDDTNLFKLAKLNGFKTFYLSDQLPGELSNIGGTRYIDVLRNDHFDLDKSEELSDDYLFWLLDNLSEAEAFSGRDFIVLHQNCVHTPYRKFSKRLAPNEILNGSGNQLVDYYDSGIFYNDRILSGIFNRFNKQKAGRFYIIWSSDHNELLGEDGLFSHGHLVGLNAEIPFMFQSNDADFMKEMRGIFCPTHYEVAKSVARLLGWDIKNPNEEENLFYINGNDQCGRFGYIQFKKDILNRKIEYPKAPVIPDAEKVSAKQIAHRNNLEGSDTVKKFALFRRIWGGA